MSMRLARTAFSFFSMLLPVAAGAVDLNLAAEGVTGYDDNIFRSSRVETDDMVFRLTPTVGLSSEGSKLGWSLRYRPTYEIFAWHTGANELTHDLMGRLRYTLDDKTQIQVFDRYRRLDVLNVPDDDGVDDETDVVPDDDIRRQEIDINDGSLSLSHTISPKWSSQTSVSYRLFYPSRRNANDSKSFSGSQSFQYAWNAANDIGFGGSVTAQMYDDLGFQPATNTFFYSLFGRWVRRFGDRTTLSMQVGPALVHTDQADSDVAISGSVGEPRFPHTPLRNGFGLDFLRQLYPSLAERWVAPNGTVPLTAADDPVPAGSVLVPSSETCTNTYVAAADRCQPRIIVFNDPTNPTDPGSIEAAAITGAAPVTLNLLGSDAGTRDVRFTVFAEAEITQRWTPTLTSTLSYSRRDATASAQGSATVADTVSLVTRWRPSELWDLSIRGTYLRRESATELSQEVPGTVERDPADPAYLPYVELNGALGYIEFNRAIESERWSIWARVARRLTRRTTVTLRLGYVDQETKRSDRNPNTFENFTAFVGVRYDLDPIRF